MKDFLKNNEIKIAALITTILGTLQEEKINYLWGIQCFTTNIFRCGVSNTNITDVSNNFCVYPVLIGYNIIFIMYDRSVQDIKWDLSKAFSKSMKHI